MMKKYIILCGLLIAAICQSAYAAQARTAAAGEPYVFDNNSLILGIGLMYHHFFVSDDFRDGGSYGIPGSNDEIKNVPGFDINAELLLNKNFAIKSKYGLAAGYRFEYFARKYEYAYGTGGTLERKISMTNQILYCSVSQPLDSNKYCFAGALAGLGFSKYKINLDYSSSNDYGEHSWGVVLPIGAFIDWGNDGIGGRFGAELLLSRYLKVDGQRPDSTGGRLYMNVRYAF
jgi:hypothetical protein